MVMLPIKPVTLPSDLAGQINGKLGPCQLVARWFPGWGQLSAHRIAGECWEAMALMCRVENGGLDRAPQLTLTSPADGYRTYEQQVRTFLTRMTTIYNPLTVTSTTRTWNGVKYWLKRGYAPCAVPGTSNHGWGLAFDTGIFNPGKAATKGVYFVESITSNATVWGWVLRNAQSFGFSWEGVSDSTQRGAEPWHLRYVEGDRIPQRVLDLRAWFAGQGG